MARPASDSSTGRSYNFVATNWRGEYPLWVTFWILGVPGTLILGAMPYALVRAFEADTGYGPINMLIVTAITWFWVVVIGAWLLVGVWRSAGRHSAERARVGKSARWAGLAKAAVVLGFVRLVTAFGVSGVPLLIEMSRMTLNDLALSDYSIRVLRDGTEVEIAGGIKFGLTDDFLRTLRASPQIAVVHLSSIGGQIAEADKLATVIRDRKLDTYAGHYCKSVCMLAFAAGRERWILKQAKLGVHGPAFPGTDKSRPGSAVELQRNNFARAGIDRDFIERALATSNKDMWTPSIEELRRAGVVTRISDGSDFAASGFGADFSTETIGEWLAGSQPYQTLKAKLPAEFAGLVEVYHAAYVAGGTENDVNTAFFDRFARIFQSQRLRAADDVLVESWRLYADQYEALGAIDPTLCYQYASGDRESGAATRIPQNLTQRESVLKERVFATAGERPPVTQQMTEQILDKAFTQLKKSGIGPDGIKLIQGDEPKPEQHAEYCRAHVAFFREAASLGTAEAGLLFRGYWGK
jgi:hypothetical protein